MIQLRSAESQDLVSLRSLIPALIEAAMPHRPRLDSLLRSAERRLAETIRGESAGSEVILAEDREGRPLGFIHLRIRAAGDTGEPAAALADLAVHPSANGAGVARALLAFADGWTRWKGMPGLTLTQFAADPTLRTLYATLGYPD